MELSRPVSPTRKREEKRKRKRASYQYGVFNRASRGSPTCPLLKIPPTEYISTYHTSHSNPWISSTLFLFDYLSYINLETSYLFKITYTLSYDISSSFGLHRTLYGPIDSAHLDLLPSCLACITKCLSLASLLPFYTSRTLNYTLSHQLTLCILKLPVDTQGQCRTALVFLLPAREWITSTTCNLSGMESTLYVQAVPHECMPAAIN